MNAKQMRMLRNIIMVATVVTGLVCWFAMPDVFANTSLFHVGAGKSGTKLGALIILLFPLFALIPNKEDSEIHTGDPAEREKLEEEHALREAKQQVAVALFMGVTVTLIMGIAALVL